MINQEKLKYYAAFSFLNVRPLFKSKLFNYFNCDIKRAFEADENEIAKMSQELDISIPRGYFEKKHKLNPEKCVHEAFLDKNIKIVTAEDEKYPPLLKEIADFPLSLYYKGNLDNISYDCNLAIVGSRNASSAAKFALESLISKFKDSNITIISGLAAGIDAQAHKSALDNNLKTIAVIGSGLDITYPAQNRYLYDEIEKKGVIFSEFPLKTKPAAQNFPQRNRIVVGMSKGVLVAEAQIKSGAMISAKLTLDYDRELMCIPGNILNPNTEGVYHLIRNGAGIVSNAQDILNQMNWEITIEDKNDKDFELNEHQRKILDIISIEAKTFDEIITDINQDVSQTMITLTELELKGLIKQSNNKYYKCK